MTFFDFIYLAFALVTTRFWYPALRRLCLEIWEIGDPEHGANARLLMDRRAARTPVHEALVPPGSPGRPLRGVEPSGTTGATGFARKATPHNRNLSSRKRWQGGFGRRGV